MDIPDNVVIAPPMMNTALLWIGFDQEATRERLRAEGFDTFDDLYGMKEKDIRDLADSYTRRTVADGRAIFGLKRTRTLSASFTGFRTLPESARLQVWTGSKMPHPFKPSWI